MKTNYNNMKVEELIAEETKLKADLLNLVFQNKVGQLADTSQIRIVKKNIARVKTALKLKQGSGAKE